MDLATDLGEQGFRWIFIVHFHRNLNLNRVLNQAGDYFRETYGGHMVSLSGLIFQQAQVSTRSEEKQQEDAGATHAGTTETSFALFLRPDLVSSGYKNAKPLPARDRKHQVEIAKATDWPGYWGSPRLATAAAGTARWKAGSSGWAELALRLLDGFDYTKIKRFGDETPPSEPIGGQNFRQHNQAIETKQQEWLKKRGLE